jgi:hypothetical protein
LDFCITAMKRISKKLVFIFLLNLCVVFFISAMFSLYKHEGGINIFLLLVVFGVLLTCTFSFLNLLFIKIKKNQWRIAINIGILVFFYLYFNNSFELIYASVLLATNFILTNKILNFEHKKKA